MKKIIVLFAIIVMVVAAVNAQVNITMPEYDDNEHFLHLGDEDNLLFFNVQNNGINPVILQEVGISTMNLNFMAPAPDMEFYLYHNGEYSSPSFYLFDINFPILGDVIQPGEQITYYVKGQVSQFSPIGASFKLGLSGPGNFQMLEENSGIAITPVVSAGWGNQWTIVNSQTNPNQPMHRMDIYPYRNPSETTNEFPASRYVLDTLYVYPGQYINYSGVMNMMPGNSYPNSVVTMDSYVSIGSLYNDLVPWFHYWQNGYLANLGLLYTNEFQMAWVSNTYEGIDCCGLMAISIQNQMMPGNMGQIHTSLNITNNTPQGLIQETCIDNKHIVSNTGVIGDIDGTGFVDQGDPNIGIQQWINQEILQTSFNPTDSINIMRQACLAPHPSTANIWALNGFVHNPNDPFFSSLGIGQEYESFLNGPLPNYTNDNGLITIDTGDNFASIFWRNSNGSYDGQDIIITGNNRALKWSIATGIEPFEIEILRNEIQFQIPPDAKLLSVSTKQLNYTPVASDDPIIPIATPILNNAFPNPFTSQTSICYNLPKSQDVQIGIYNVKGQLVKTLVDEIKTTGDYSVTWNGTDQNGRVVSTGIYFCKMVSEKYSATKKVILIK